MAHILKQSTATQFVAVRMFDDADHVTPETGITGPTITIAKNGSSLGGISDGTFSETAGGMYWVRLNATDTNTLGTLVIRVVKAGSDDGFIYAHVLAQSEFKADVSNLDATVSSRSSHDAAAVTTAVWDKAISSHVGADTFGAKNQKVVPSETIEDYKATGFSTHDAAAVWDKAISSHVTADTFGAKNQKVVPSETLDDYKADITGLSGAAVWDAAISSHTASGSFGAKNQKLTPSEAAADYKADVTNLDATVSSRVAAGVGADTVTINFKVAGNNQADANAWITSDAAGTILVAGTLVTDSNGNAVFLLDSGNTYYMWLSKDGINSVQGEEFTATAD